MDYESVLRQEPYRTGHKEKGQIFSDYLSELTNYHREKCGEYNRFLNSLGVEAGRNFSEEEIPMVPVSVFKEIELKSIPEEEVFKTITSSGTTGQRVSRICLDNVTATNQQKTLYKIVQDFIGEERLPFLVIDSPKVLKDRNMFSARGAGILGFSIFASKMVYALNEDMELDEEAVQEFAEKYKGKKVLVFGFTYMIWKHFYQALKEKGIVLSLDNAMLIHGGGWKKMQQEAVTNEVFKEEIRKQTGIARISNYYGMAEQTGCIYMECEEGHLHASTYSDILIRRPEDFKVCDIGEEGMIQVLSLLPESYPGHSILTEDKGILLGEDDCPCGRCGKYFTITGRVKHSEVRGAVIPMKDKITCLAGTMEPDRTPWKIFHPVVMEFLTELSESIKEDRSLKAYEEVRAFGFWCRKSNLEHMKQRMEQLGEQAAHIGRGKVFHLAPSNVPVLFAYSLVLGMLSGNSNLVRISSRGTVTDMALCEKIQKVLENYDALKKRIGILQYERDDELTAKLMNDSDGCVLWGGDRTVERMQSLITNVDIVTTAFPDRYGICIMGAKQLSGYTEEQMALLAHRFYNDTYAMDQNACSSPHTVLWITEGEDENSCEETAKRFWKALYEESLRYPLTEDKISGKYGELALQTMTHKEIGNVSRYENRLYVAELKELPQSLEQFRGKFGFFYEYYTEDISKAAESISQKLQTVTYAGIEAAEVLKLSEHEKGRGISRIVPIGEALQMDMVWDGRNLIEELSRTVTLH